VGSLVIGIAGVAGAGKSSLAEVFEERHGLVRTPFAGPIKDMLSAFLRASGVTDLTIHRMVNEDLKEQPAPVLGGRSPRQAMQALGTEWGRSFITPDLWTESWRYRAGLELLRGIPGVTVDDIRFPNEVAAVRSMGGVVIRVDRPGFTGVNLHPSEHQVLEPDHVVINNGSLTDLRAKAELLSTQLISHPFHMRPS
jgi:hypothetical protein